MKIGYSENENINSARVSFTFEDKEDNDYQFFLNWMDEFNIPYLTTKLELGENSLYCVLVQKNNTEKKSNKNNVKNVW